MGRIRTIKPSFWTDSKTGRLSDTGKCLMIGLLNASDDVGVHPNDVEEIHVKVFPYRGQTDGTKKALQELVTAGLVATFSTGNGREYLYINGFLKHQAISRPSRPVISDWKHGWTLKDYLRAKGGQEIQAPEPAPARGKGARHKGKEEVAPKVYLGDGEMKALEKYVGGTATLTAYAERLSDYILSKGKDPYDDHAAVIRQWYRKDKEDGKVKKKSKFDD